MSESSTIQSGISQSSAKSAAGTSVAEGFVGIGAIALAILGLADILPVLLASIATIAIGVALAFEGGAISARYATLLDEGQTKTDESVRWGGVTSLFLAGAAGIALGILSLLGIVPGILIPASAITFGAALIIDSGANSRLAELEAHYSESFRTSEKIIKRTDFGSAGLQVLTGLAAVALGIIALVGVSTIILSLVAMLAIGTVNLVTGSMIGSRMANIFR